MWNRSLALDIVRQVEEALERVISRTRDIADAAYFTDSPEGMEKLDGVCMLFIAVGESLKNLDKVTEGALLKQYPTVDWTGIKGLEISSRTIISMWTPSRSSGYAAEKQFLF